MNKQEAQKLEKKILDQIPDGKIILGLSGGPDSVFLLHLLKDHDLIAAHLNHKIRRSADKDQEFVEKLCSNLNITLETIAVDIKEKSRKSKRGLEESGRIERYKFFTKLAKKAGAKFIITAHHADDNLETILMNLIRGGSLKALAGMPLEEKQNDISLLRPLIQVSKKEILEYLQLNCIPYRKDQTNFDTKYTRNNLRHKIIPKLEEINPNISSTIAKNSKNLMEIQDFIESQAKNWIEKNSLEFSQLSFPQKSFVKLHCALQKAILIELHKLHTGDTNNLESVHIKDAIAVINGNTGNKQKKMGRLEIYLKKGMITLKKTAKKSNINGLKFP